jgi:hypothetical protein
VRLKNDIRPVNAVETPNLSVFTTETTAGIPVERLSQKGSLLFYIFKPPISDQVWRLGKFYDFG